MQRLSERPPQLPSFSNERKRELLAKSKKIDVKFYYQQNAIFAEYLLKAVIIDFHSLVMLRKLYSSENKVFWTKKKSMNKSLRWKEIN